MKKTVYLPEEIINKIAYDFISEEVENRNTVIFLIMTINLLLAKDHNEQKHKLMIEDLNKFIRTFSDNNKNKMDFIKLSELQEKVSKEILDLSKKVYLQQNI